MVGGGNSAGQAAVYLAKFASRVTILVRGESLAQSMSEYLITEIDATANIDVMYGVEVVGGAGDGRLETIDVRHRASGAVDTLPAAALFVLIGAEPFTQWLPSDVARDDWGFVITGPSEETPSRLPFESTLPGVFAVGDVRRDSTKRVASAAGEGAVCVRLVHEYLAAQRDRLDEHAGQPRPPTARVIPGTRRLNTPRVVGWLTNAPGEPDRHVVRAILGCVAGPERCSQYRRSEDLRGRCPMRAPTPYVDSGHQHQPPHHKESSCTAVPSPSPPAKRTPATRNRWRILGVLVLALLVTSIDHTIINVAMPRLVGDLGASSAAAAMDRRRLHDRVRRAAAHRRKPRRPVRPPARARSPAWPRSSPARSSPPRPARRPR